jgi:hypothetical protein
VVNLDDKGVKTVIKGNEGVVSITAEENPSDFSADDLLRFSETTMSAILEKDKPSLTFGFEPSIRWRDGVATDGSSTKKNVKDKFRFPFEKCSLSFRAERIINHKDAEMTSLNKQLNDFLKTRRQND